MILYQLYQSVPLDDNTLLGPRLVTNTKRIEKALEVGVMASEKAGIASRTNWLRHASMVALRHAMLCS